MKPIKSAFAEGAEPCLERTPRFTNRPARFAPDEMRLKQVFRQKPHDHYVFKCKTCELEYPVVKQSE